MASKILKKLIKYVATEIKNMVFELKCKTRNHHKPLEDDLELFLSNPSLTKITHCITCNIPLELQLDEDDESVYTVSEDW